MKLYFPKITYDPNHEYSVPARWYDRYHSEQEISRTLISLGAYTRSDLKDRITLLDDMREVFGAALKYLGYSVNTTNPDEIEEAKSNTEMEREHTQVRCNHICSRYRKR